MILIRATFRTEILYSHCLDILTKRTCLCNVILNHNMQYLLYKNEMEKKIAGCSKRTAFFPLKNFKQIK